ncbi:hypothetical protein ACFWZT_01820 [Streptomyces alboflavus]|uniref:Rieske domain-containing protein n=1 Tax=Streptomyces alboflavus TaxID=67267 RepID=A0A1Z1WFD0_9ACTN|nr:hypothetical protein [Streptomyces alboflavus]ARX85163.1 hypothetical protein SMD44_04622 [Streptomyces alboflavus]
MTTPPDDRTFRREMATAYRSGWHFIDLVTAIPHPGDSLMVTLVGEPVVIVRDDDEDIRAYRCLRRPRGAPQPVRCAVRYGMVFVNLDQRDHQVIDKRKREADRQAVERQTASADSLAATPRSA